MERWSLYWNRAHIPICFINVAIPRYHTEHQEKGFACIISHPHPPLFQIVIKYPPPPPIHSWHFRSMWLHLAKSHKQSWNITHDPRVCIRHTITESLFTKEPPTHACHSSDPLRPSSSGVNYDAGHSQNGFISTSSIRWETEQWITSQAHSMSYITSTG